MARSSTERSCVEDAISKIGGESGADLAEKPNRNDPSSSSGIVETFFVYLLIMTMLVLLKETWDV